MKKLLVSLAGLSLAVMQPTLATPAFAQSGPAVKMSKTGICHPRGGTYYSRTKKFTPYKSMQACLKAGGRRPKR